MLKTIAALGRGESFEQADYYSRGICSARLQRNLNARAFILDLAVIAIANVCKQAESEEPSKGHHANYCRPMAFTGMWDVCL